MKIRKQRHKGVCWQMSRASKARSSKAKPETLDSQDAPRPSCSKAMTMAFCHPARAVSCFPN
ncbi:MAG TPA: hypothetical protein DCK76_05405 [Desulfotomaculum sp.]|nr:hypothetical protein [Desulfotomaculum sp.]